jgi:hypothetical protein
MLALCLFIDTVTIGAITFSRTPAAFACWGSRTPFERGTGDTPVLRYWCWFGGFSSSVMRARAAASSSSSWAMRGASARFRPLGRRARRDRRGTGVDTGHGARAPGLTAGSSTCSSRVSGLGYGRGRRPSSRSVSSRRQSPCPARMVAESVSRCSLTWVYRRTPRTDLETLAR